MGDWKRQRCRDRSCAGGERRAGASGAPTIDTTAQHAVVLDYDTGTILLDKAGDDRIEPASMSKMMTAYVVFEYLARGRPRWTTCCR